MYILPLSRDGLCSENQGDTVAEGFFIINKEKIKYHFDCTIKRNKVSFSVQLATKCTVMSLGDDPFPH